MSQAIGPRGAAALLVLVLALAFSGAAAFGQEARPAQSDSSRSIQAGKKLYDEGEYQNAIIKFFEALAQAKPPEEKAEAHFYLALSYYALGDTIRSSEQLKNLFRIQPAKTIDERLFPSGFIALSGRIRDEILKEPAPAAGAKAVDRRDDGRDRIPPGNKRIMFKFGGGWTSIGGGDLNAGLEGIEKEWAEVAQTFGWRLNGEYVGVGPGQDFGGELVLPLLGRFAIGLGAGTFNASKESSIKKSSTVLTSTETYTFTPKVRAVPLAVSVYYFVPLGKTLTLSLRAGAAYYLTSLNADYRIDQSDGSFDTYALAADGKGFGIHGGVGLEARLSDGLSLFIEAGGRQAKITGFMGTSQHVSSYGYTDQASGTLFYYETQEFFSKIYFGTLDVADKAPSGSNIQNAREARIDFSGWSLRAGIIVKI